MRSPKKLIQEVLFLLFSFRSSRDIISAQDTIPFHRIHPGGYVIYPDHRVSCFIRFSRHPYILCSRDTQEQIFKQWCSLLDQVPPEVRGSLHLLSLLENRDEHVKPLSIPKKEDGFNPLREELESIADRLSLEATGGLQNYHLFSFTTDPMAFSKARALLDSLCAGIIKTLESLQVQPEILTGEQLFSLYYRLFHPEDHCSCSYSLDSCIRRGINPKEIIAPSSFSFSEKNSFSIGSFFGSSGLFQFMAPELDDRLLTDICQVPCQKYISLHFEGIPQEKAIKAVKGKMSDLDKMKIEEQKKALRAGYDMDILPSDLNTYGGEAKLLLEDLHHGEHYYSASLVMTVMGASPEDARSSFEKIARIARGRSCNLMPLDYLQEDGLFASLPFGINALPYRRGLTTSALGIMTPFDADDRNDSGEALYYGIHPITGHPLLLDRKSLRNPNGLILGTPGSGKSFSAKREMLSAYLGTDDSIIICDPESEYGSLTALLGGVVIPIGPNSETFINPMDLDIQIQSSKDALRLKCDFLLSLYEVIVGDVRTVRPIEKTLLDRAIPMLYAPYLACPIPENMPVLEDLYLALLRMDHPEAKEMAATLEIYVKGSLNLFNHRSNVNLSGRLICFDIKELGTALRKLGMLIVQDQVWNRVAQNRIKGIGTRYYIDEFHLLLNHPQTAAYSAEIYKRFRKWGGIPTGITQNVKDLLSSSEIHNIFENSDFLMLLNQGSDDRHFLREALHLTDEEEALITASPAGSGLIVAEGKVYPFKDSFPADSSVYHALTTKPSEMNR